jgi:hypothetical protein
MNTDNEDQSIEELMLELKELSEKIAKKTT